jgi:hypothetical protein
LTGQPVNTWLEEWQHECETRAVLKMSKAECDAFFNGTSDKNGKTIERGIISIWGAKAAEDLRSLMQRLLDACANKR